MANYGELTSEQITNYLNYQSLNSRQPIFSMWIAGIGDPEDYILKISIDRGIESPKGRGNIKIGTSVIRASNSNNTFFDNGQSTIKDNAQIKIWMGFKNLHIPVFSGVVKKVRPLLKSNEIEITCTDDMGILLQSTITGHQGVTNTPKLLMEAFASDTSATSSISSTEEYTTVFDNPEFDTIFKLTAMEYIADAVFSVPYFDNNGILQLEEREYKNKEDWVYHDGNTFDCRNLANSEVINRADLEYYENFFYRYEIQQSINDYRLRTRDLRLPILNSDLVASYLLGSTDEEIDNDLEGVKFTSSSGSSIIDCIAIRVKQDGASGYITAKIYDDSAGSPNSLLGTSRQKASGGLSTNYTWKYFYFDTPVFISESTSYWIILDSSTVTGTIYWQRSAITTLTGLHAYYDSGWTLEDEKECKHIVRGSQQAQRVAEDIVRFYREPKKRIQIIAPGSPHLQLFDEVYIDLKTPFQITGRYVIENRRHIFTSREFVSIDILREAN